VKISTQIRYGLRSLCDIAYNSAGSPAQVRCISERQGISPRYIEQIFQKLKKAGIIKSVRGPTGGYYLARRPEEITVGDVIRAVDGKNIQLVFCAGEKRGPKKACDRYGKCVVSDIWGEASNRLMDYFNSVTLNSICEEARVRGVGV
jgi:Rrf2 family transcriptional regulator, iron-sulfur cluster assembly transcription factor